MRFLEVSDVQAGYGAVDILHDVSLVLEEQEIVSVLGPNGSGKSTLMRVIAGVLIPGAGQIHFMGEDITSLPPEERIALGLSYVPQEEHVFPSLTVRENLEMGGYILDDGVEEQIASVQDLFPELKQRMEQKAGTLSGGQQQMVALGRGLITRPDLLLLDEPTSALQPSLVKVILGKIQEINERGVSILLVAHTLETLKLSDRAYLLTAGEVVVSGETAELLERERVRDVFFSGEPG